MNNTVSITVLSMKDAMEQHREFDALITIENADGNLRQLRVTDGRPHLVLAFNDIDVDDGSDLIGTREQIQSAVTFGRMVEGKSLLVHCHAGRCRSPAIALAILADRVGQGREEEAVDAMLRIAPKAAPNLVALQLADEVLTRDGRLVAAWMNRYESADEIVRLRELKREIYKRKFRGGAET